MIAKAVEDMRFYALQIGRSEDGSEFYFELHESSPVGNAPKCPICGNFYGMLPCVPPISGTLVAEKSVFDLAANFGDEVLLSERCVRSLVAQRIRGLSQPSPIELMAVEGPRYLTVGGKYFLASVAQWGAEIDREKSALKTASSDICTGCGYAGLIEGYDRVCLVSGSWQGYDIFTVKGLPGCILITDQLKDLCRDLGLSVCGIVPAENYSMAPIATRGSGGNPTNGKAAEAGEKAGDGA